MSNTQDSRITSVNRKAASEWNYKDHATDGVHFLTNSTPAPNAIYYGFTPCDYNSKVTSIEYIDESKVSGDITKMTLLEGLYYPIAAGFKTITITGGTAMIYRVHQL